MKLQSLRETVNSRLSNFNPPEVTPAEIIFKNFQKFHRKTPLHRVFFKFFFLKIIFMKITATHFLPFPFLLFLQNNKKFKTAGALLKKILSRRLLSSAAAAAILVMQQLQIYTLPAARCNVYKQTVVLR